MWEKLLIDQKFAKTTKKYMAKKKKAVKASVEEKKLEENAGNKQETAEEGFNKDSVYPVQEAVKYAKELGQEKFDASIEAHFRLGIDPRKGDQQIRGTVSLPYGTGKKIKIAAFVEEDNKEAAQKAGADIVGSDDLIAEIKKSEKTDFQVAVAEPSMMKKLAPIAKILGTRGLMPSPKNDTVTSEPAKTIEELKKGKISFKNDDTANVHAVIGKKSFSDDKLADNFNALLEEMRRIKPSSAKGTYIKNACVSSSMGKAVKIDIS